MLQSGKKLVRKEGPLSLWKGVSSSIVLVLNPIIQFAVYEFLKKKLTIHVKGRNFSINLEDHPFYDLLIFFIGAVSKVISTILTFPYTVIRTKQHISKSRLSLRQAFHQIYSEASF